MAVASRPRSLSPLTVEDGHAHVERSKIDTGNYSHGNGSSASRKDMFQCKCWSARMGAA